MIMDERDQWRKRMEEKTDSTHQMLLKIYSELKGDDFNQGLYKQTMQNTSDIDRIDKDVEEMKPAFRLFKKTVWGVLAAAGGALIWFVQKVIGKIFPALADYIQNNYHNHT